MKDHAKKQNDVINEKLDANLKTTHHYLEQNAKKIDEKTKWQDEKIREARHVMEDNIDDIKRQVTLKFLEQHVFNKSLNERMMTNTRKMHGIKADTEVILNQLKAECIKTVRSNQDMNNEFKCLLQFVESMVETLVMENLLQVQDEVDRTQMNLWGVN